MNYIKVRSCIIIVISILFSLILCGCGNSRYEDDYYTKISRDEYETMTEIISSFVSLVDEAYGHADRMKMLFDYADETGYDYSVFLGDYYFDRSNDSAWVIHKTYSQCIDKSPLDKIMGCYSYQCATKSDINYLIKHNSFVSTKNCTWCSKCCG